MAVVLTVGLFLYWLLLGRAVLRWLWPKEIPLRAMLLAPSIGMAMILLAVYGLNHLGFPVRRFAGLLTATSVIPCLLLWKEETRDFWALRAYRPFAALLLLAFLLTGRPLFEFGFDWMSYANTDMQFYCYGALRLLNHGFFEMPPLREVVALSNVSWFSFFQDVPKDFNHGAPVLLAWVSGLTGLDAYQVYMPLILSLHIALISGTAALVLRRDELRNTALWTCLLLSLSPLNTLATLYQLMPHVMGLSLFISALVLVLRSNPAESCREALLVGLVASALFVAYNMVFILFLVPAVCLYFGFGWVRGEVFRFEGALGRASVVVLAVLVICNLHLYIFVSAAKSGAIARAVSAPFQVSDTLFHHYLVPSGLATLWGFQSVTGLTSEPWLSVSIVLGALLLLVAFAASIWRSLLRDPIAYPTLVMLSLGAYLFANRSDFALYKLAMYIQPFALGTLAMTFSSLIQGNAWQSVLLGLLALSGAPCQLIYAEISRDNHSVIEGRALAEIRDVSKSRMAEDIRELVHERNPRTVVSDTHNSAIAMLQAFYLRGRSLSFPSNMGSSHLAPRAFLMHMFSQRGQNPILDLLQPELGNNVERSLTAYRNRYSLTEFSLENAASMQSLPFWMDTLRGTSNKSLEEGTEDLILLSTPKHSVANRFHLAFCRNENFVALPINQVKNHLIPLHDVYQLEKDYFFPKDSMAALQRYLVGEVINPTPEARLVLSVSSSLKGDGENLLPGPCAVGSERHCFSLVGRGSARVFSPTLQAKIIGERAYLAIDMGVDGQLFPEKRVGLMRLFGNDVPLDRRKTVCFARDVSLVSELEYQSLKPPTQISNFPEDLANAGLEYSGVYEDGWTSENAFFVLSQSKEQDILVISGSIPLTAPAESQLAVLVDNKELDRRTLGHGEFKFHLPLSTDQEKRRRVQIVASDAHRLPSPDNRPVSAYLHFVGFTREDVPVPSQPTISTLR